jgi:predicted dehydrogenase
MPKTAGSKVRVGVIGLGSRGLLCAAATNIHPDADLRAVSDIYLEAEDAFRLAGFGTPFFVDLGKMLEDTSLDAVFICTPPETHLSLVRECRGKDLDIFVGSPLADSLSAGRELAEFAGRKGFIHSLDYPFPYVPIFQKAQDLLRSGVIDEIIRFRAYSYHTGRLIQPAKEHQEPGSAGFKEIAGGASPILCLLCWLFGPPDSLYARINRSAGGAESGLSAILDLPRGLSGSLDISWIRPHYPSPALRVVIEGTGGILDIADEQVKLHLYKKKAGYDKGWTSFHRADIPSPSRFFLCRDGVYEAADAFIQAAKAKKLPAFTWKEGFDIMRVVEAVRSSSAESRKISLSEVG